MSKSKNLIVSNDPVVTEESIIIAGQEIIHRPPGELKPYPGNARVHSDKQIAILMASIREFGFIGTVVTNEEGMILAGHGRVEAAKRLKLATVPTRVRAGLTKSQQRALVLMDNRSAQLSDWNDEQLKIEIEELENEDFNIELTGFSTAEITLNVLLSFAQFEREVTGERIRDKIAASKKKGLWMGGSVPLGYDVRDRKLIINAGEAKTLRHIFQRYMDLGCVRLLQTDLSQNGIRSKTGNHIISRGSLYKLLSNPIYIGQIRHKNICHPGQQEAIIDQALWERVQRHMEGNTIGEKTQSRKTEPALLAGKLFDASGERVVPIYANKKGRRYRYYVSQSLTKAPADTAISGWRLPGREIEHVVVHTASQLLQDRVALTAALQEAGIKTRDIPAALSEAKNMATTTGKMERIITRVELRQDGLRLTLILDEKGMTIIHDIPMRMKRRGVEMRMVVGGHGPTRTDPTLVKTIARAHKWFQELVTGRAATLAEIAKRESMNLGDVSRTLNLAFLAPDIVEGFIAGRQPADLSAQKLLRRTNLPLEWAQQRNLLRFIC